MISLWYFNDSSTFFRQNYSLRSGHKKKRAREKGLPHPSRVSLARARSLFRPLLPSACYAGYTEIYEHNKYFELEQHISSGAFVFSFFAVISYD